MAPPSWVLLNAPDDHFRQLTRPISWWLQQLATTFRGQDRIFFAIIERVLELHRQDIVQPADDAVFKAINHPVGHVVQAALSWWYRQGLTDDQLLNAEILEIYTAVCDADVEIYRHGRVLLGAHSITIFRVAPDWTKNNLLQFFDWDRSAEEARAVWQGFLWSARLHAPFLRELKSEFLAVTQHYDELGDVAEQYAALLTFAALDDGDVFLRQELAAATRSLPAEGRRRAAFTLLDAFMSVGDQRAEYWNNRIVPYLRRIWPRERGADGAPEAFARLCVAAGGGDLFREAVEELQPLLASVEHPGVIVHELRDAGLCARVPNSALNLLDLVIDNDLLWPPPELANCLAAILNARPELEEDERFRRLGVIVRRQN